MTRYKGIVGSFCETATSLDLTSCTAHVAKTAAPAVHLKRRDSLKPCLSIAATGREQLRCYAAARDSDGCCPKQTSKLIRSPLQKSLQVRFGLPRHFGGVYPSYRHRPPSFTLSSPPSHTKSRLPVQITLLDDCGKRPGPAKGVERHEHLAERQPTSLNPGRLLHQAATGCLSC